MKYKNLAIPLLALWMLPGLLVLLCYEVERGVWRAQRFAQLSSGRTPRVAQTLFLPKPEKPDWVVPGKEFIRYGKLYDVLALAETEDQFIIRCYPDNKEDSIVARFNNYLRRRSTSDHSNTRLKKFFASKFIAAEAPFLNSPTAVQNALCIFEDCTRHSFSIEIIPPPPWRG